MEGIELRDFAVEHAERQIAESIADLEQLERRRSECSGWRRFWRTYVRITIHEAECRDHLALERTFLAYVRTSTAYAQFGVTIAQLFRLNTNSTNTITSSTLRIGKALGATTEAIAIIVLLLGAAYFMKQQTGLIKGNTMARGYEVVAMVVLSFALFGIILGLLVAADKW